MFQLQIRHLIRSQVSYFCLPWRACVLTLWHEMRTNYSQRHKVLPLSTSTTAHSKSIFYPQHYQKLHDGAKSSSANICRKFWSNSERQPYSSSRRQPVKQRPKQFKIIDSIRAQSITRWRRITISILCTLQIEDAKHSKATSRVAQYHSRRSRMGCGKHENDAGKSSNKTWKIYDNLRSVRQSCRTCRNQRRNSSAALQHKMLQQSVVKKMTTL